MLTFDEIKELIELVGREKLQGLEIERSGFRLRIDGQATESSVSFLPAPTVAAGDPVTTPAAPPPPAAPSSGAAPDVGEGSDDSGVPADAHVLTSPIVGTFYTAPSPDSEAYVRPGDRVKKGQVLCIVEAMKLMNEIESDVDGVVLQIIPKNAQPVEFGEPLFAIEAD